VEIALIETSDRLQPLDIEQGESTVPQRDVRWPFLRTSQRIGEQSRNHDSVSAWAGTVN
jgi:hypothetical protein